MHRFDENIQLARRLDDPGQEQLLPRTTSSAPVAWPNPSI
jgi:hypothetical protein